MSPARLRGGHGCSCGRSWDETARPPRVRARFAGDPDRRTPCTRRRRVRAGGGGLGRAQPHGGRAGGRGAGEATRGAGARAVRARDHAHRDRGARGVGGHRRGARVHRVGDARGARGHDHATGGATAVGPAGETAIVLMLVAALHGAIVWWGMAHDPSLYVDAWYAHGGLRRTVQVLASDVLGPNGVTGASRCSRSSRGSAGARRSGSTAAPVSCTSFGRGRGRLRASRRSSRVSPRSPVCRRRALRPRPMRRTPTCSSWQPIRCATTDSMHARRRTSRLSAARGTRFDSAPT